AEAAVAQPGPDVASLERVTRPCNDDGLYAAGLRFGDPRVMAVLAALVSFCHVIVGFTNHQLVERVGALLQGSRSYTCRQATYDLRRLKRKGLIAKIPHSHRYALTSRGRMVAVLLANAVGRVIARGVIRTHARLREEG